MRYLSSDDMKLMASESALNILASVTTDSNYVDTGDEVSVTGLIERLLSREGNLPNSSQICLSSHENSS